MKKKRKTKEQSLEGLRQFLNRQAKKNRNNLGKWENILAKHLRDLGYRFKMQYPIIHKTFGYIVDFLLTDYPIFIEVDGKWHFTKDQIKKDNKRSRHIQKEGYFPLRFTNKQISIMSKETIDQIIKTKIELIKQKENG